MDSSADEELEDESLEFESSDEDEAGDFTLFLLGGGLLLEPSEDSEEDLAFSLLGVIRVFPLFAFLCESDNFEGLWCA